MKIRSLVLAIAMVVVVAAVDRVSAATGDIVVYASDVTTLRGNWTKASDGTAAGGQLLSSADNGWATADNPLASPADYFEATITAAANTPYHVWLRVRAAGNSKWNDSVWVQFSDAVGSGGGAIYRTSTTNALMVNLENCSGCGVSGWGWQDKGWWTGQSPIVQFASSGSHTIRVQTREDGAQIDQIVLSPATYMWSAPGPQVNDNTIVPKSASSPPPAAPAPPPSGGSTPYSGSAAAIPGTIQNEDFDNGGEGVAYHDNSSANEGGAYRSTGVDIASGGSGSVVGWVSAGEWLNYTVNVASAGTYTATFRVASSGQGGVFHLEMNGTNVTGPLTVPNTGGWDSWQVVTKAVTLNAGAQVARLVMDSIGGVAVGNFDWMQFTASASSPPPPPPTGSGPSAPSSPNPPNGTIGETTTPNLSWQSSGATSYSVRLGTSNPPPVVVSSSGDYWYPPPALNGGTTYYWQIAATNSSGTTLGPVWSFTTSGGGSAPPPPAPPPPTQPPATSGTLRMMTWNIRSGTDLNSNYVLPQQVQLMASQNPDVIVLQEVATWNEWQPTRFHDLLQQATGQTWYSVWAPGTGCLAGGCIGELILSRIPISDWSTTYLEVSDAGRALINVGGVPINIFTNHLEAYDTSLRTTELNELMAWERQFPGPRLDGGDFNSWWGEWWIGQMETEYSDTWLAFTGNEDGAYTIGNVRFDYIFKSLDGGSHLTATNCWVVGTSLSDHRPYVVDFKVQ
jgi:endonuclease/exonuclease/phosphatase family metal-dependent hydrolase